MPTNTEIKNHGILIMEKRAAHAINNGEPDPLQVFLPNNPKGGTIATPEEI